MIAPKFLEGSWVVGEKDRCGSSKDFVLQRLRQIHVNDLIHIKLGRRLCSLTTVG